jgi:hypothetical protein
MLGTLDGTYHLICALTLERRFTHREDGVNVYGLALTTVSTADPSTGGNFYVAQYGILSEAEGNTATVWRVNDYHGTSLYERIPRQNSGVALFVPTSLIPNADHHPAPHNFTHADLVDVERPPAKRCTIPRRTTEAVNRYYVRERTPEEEVNEQAEVEEVGEAKEEDEKTGHDGSTAVDRQFLEGTAYAMDDHYVSGGDDETREESMYEDGQKNEMERSTKRRKFHHVRAD